MITSNISAEQFIGISGEGFFVGTPIAAYERVAAITLIIAVWYMPIYLNNAKSSTDEYRGNSVKLSAIDCTQHGNSIASLNVNNTAAISVDSFRSK